MFFGLTLNDKHQKLQFSSDSSEFKRLNYRQKQAILIPLKSEESEFLILLKSEESYGIVTIRKTISI